MRTSTTIRLAVLALAVALGAAWGFMWSPEPAPQQATPPSTRPRAAPDGAPVMAAAPVTRATIERPDWLRVVPPSIAFRTPGASARTGPDGVPFGVAFDAAIGAWQAGNYAEAATRLEPLAAAHPELAEAHFYLGTAWLLAGAPEEATAPLRRAAAHAPPGMRGEVVWYLGLALLDDARHEDARRRFADACDAGHARGCDAAAHLGIATHRRR